jgi:DNA-binding PadR family transcriptional regulator
MSGYDLTTEISGSIGYFWNVTRSQLYRELKDLAERKLISLSAKGARDRRVCSLTAAGRRAFEGWIAKPSGACVVRQPLLLALFFAEHVSQNRVRRWIAQHRQLRHERLATYENMLPHVRDAAPYPALSLEFGIHLERMTLEWLDLVEARLPAIAKSRKKKTRDNRVRRP